MVGFWWDKMENWWDGSPPSHFDLPNPGIHPSCFRWYITKRGPKRGITETYSDVFFQLKAKVYVYESQKNCFDSN